MLVFFSTNLALTDLAEDAFLRRLRNKIRIEHFSEELFDELLRRIFVKKAGTVLPRRHNTCGRSVSATAPKVCAHVSQRTLRELSADGEV